MEVQTEGETPLEGQNNHDSHIEGQIEQISALRNQIEVFSILVGRIRPDSTSLESENLSYTPPLPKPSLPSS